MVKAAPISAVVVTTLLAWGFQLEQRGVDLVGFVPSGLPAITLPSLDQSLWLGLLPAALLISLVGFVESVSVAQTLAAKRRQRIDPNQELIALGMANLGAGISGGSPVSGGFRARWSILKPGQQRRWRGRLPRLGLCWPRCYSPTYWPFTHRHAGRHDYRGSGDVD